MKSLIGRVIVTVCRSKADLAKCCSGRTWQDHKGGGGEGCRSSRVVGSDPRSEAKMESTLLTVVWQFQSL